MPVFYLSGLHWPLKGMGTDTIFDFIPPPPLNFFRPPEFLYLSLTHSTPVSYPFGLPWPHKGTGTDTIFDFIPPPPPQLNFYRPPEFLYLSLTHSMPVSYLSGLPRPHKGMGTDTIVELPVSSRPVWYLTCPLLVPYPSLTCSLLLHNRAQPYRNLSCYTFCCPSPATTGKKIH